jgi:hypothetical protein
MKCGSTLGTAVGTQRICSLHFNMMTSGTVQYAFRKSLVTTDLFAGFGQPQFQFLLQFGYDGCKMGLRVKFRHWLAIIRLLQSSAGAAAPGLIYVTCGA